MRNRIASMVIVVTIVIAAAVVLGAPASAKAKAPSPKTSTDLAEVVAGRDLGCDDFISNGETGPAPGFPKATEGECTIENLTASVSVMANGADRAEALGSLPMLCPFVRALGPTLTVVYARNWMISVVSSDLSTSKLAKPLGAKQVEIDCSGTTR